MSDNEKGSAKGALMPEFEYECSIQIRTPKII